MIVIEIIKGQMTVIGIIRLTFINSNMVRLLNPIIVNAHMNQNQIESKWKMIVFRIACLFISPLLRKNVIIGKVGVVDLLI
jgi:hypothetical protein